MAAIILSLIPITAKTNEGWLWALDYITAGVFTVRYTSNDNSYYCHYAK